MRNLAYPRSSDEGGIYTEDQPVDKIAAADLAALEEAGLKVKSFADYCGFAIEAVITDAVNQTAIEWSEADRIRFYPIQRHEIFGWALHKADLIIRRLIAAATRPKARDVYNLGLIDKSYMSLAVAAFAAPAKLPGVSPVNILERVRANATAISAREFEQLRLTKEDEKIEAEHFKLDLCDRIEAAIDQIVQSHPGAHPGSLYIDKKTWVHRIPTEENFGSLRQYKASERGAIPRLGPL